MSAVSAPDAISKSAAKKKRKSKKKANGKADGNGKPVETNGAKDEAGDDEEDEDEGIESTTNGALPSHVPREDTLHMPSSPPEPPTIDQPNALPLRNGASLGQRKSAVPEARQHEEPDDEDEDEDEEVIPSTDASSRLDAMQQERDSLRAEVTSLRQSLESLQERHDEEVSATKEAQQGKEQAETQYRKLLDKVNTIRSQLGERLKADSEELEVRRGRIEELEGSNATAREENERLQESITSLNARVEAQNSEIDVLRSRTNLSTSNFAKERDELVAREAYMREEYDVAKQAMQDWEILATDERERRIALEERAQELENQMAGQQEAYERAKSDADTQSNDVDRLQRTLRELQDERKRELRELVEQSQSQLEELRKQSQGAEESATELKRQLADMRKELDRTLPFEKEVKEKNLLIGKLRHEAVILNDHLTKALRFLKRGKPEDNVDRQLVTNHFLHFLALDRSDPKKFQILQLIAALLGWTEEQKEQAGLLRQGSMSLTGSLRVPISPFRRTPSTPSLSTDFTADSPASATTRESLAELWSEFLEREAEAGGGGSRRPSVVSQQSVRSPSVNSAVSPIGGPALGSGRGQSPEAKRDESTRAGSSNGR